MHLDSHDDQLLALGVSTVFVTGHLAEAEADDQRHTRKQAVVAEKWATLRDSFRHELHDLQGYGGTGPSLRQLTATLAHITRQWPRARRRTLLVDLLMADPFAPYQLRVTPEELRHAVDGVAAALSVPDDARTALWDAWEQALRVHRPGRFRRLRSAGAALDGSRIPGTVVAGATPAPEAVHRRLVLGGGSLGANGAAYAGGLWLLDRTAIEVDDERPHLAALSVAQTRIELIKLQMSHELVVRPGLLEDLRPTDVVAALARCEDEIDRRLTLERRRNDDDGPRIQALDGQRLTIRAARHCIDDLQRPAA